MMKGRIDDIELDELMESARIRNGDYSVKESNLIIVELLNRLLERKE